jgi:hypothetical protein
VDRIEKNYRGKKTSSGFNLPHSKLMPVPNVRAVQSLRFVQTVQGLIVQ